MSIFVRKNHCIPGFSKIGKLSIITFIIGLSGALTSTIWAVYVDSIVHNISLVGFITAFFALLSFFSYFAIIPMIERSNKSKLVSITLMIFGLSSIFFALTKNFYLFIIIGSIATIAEAIRITSWGIIVKDKSKDRELAKNEGLVYTFFNLAFLIGPLMAGFIAAKYSISAVFFLASFLVGLSLFLFISFSIKDANISKKVDHSFVKNFFDFFRNKNRALVYFLSGGVNLWWSMIYLFIPLLIIREGLNDIWIGGFLFAVAIPLILFEYKFSKVANKSGFKQIFKIGYLSVALISLVCFFLSNIYLILAFLALASVGISMIEPTSEAYFFHVIKKEEENRFYGPYNTTIDTNHFVGKIIVSVLLIFLPFRFIFLLFFILMTSFFLLSFKAKKIVEARLK